MAQQTYEEFLKSKMATSPWRGFEVPEAAIHPVLKPHQRDIVRWSIHRGTAGIFPYFGLGKTLIQLEIARHIMAREGGRFLIVAPLGVRQEFKKDVEKLTEIAKTADLKITFVRRIEECKTTGLHVTNYESVRDGRLDVSGFVGVSLDEASVLRTRGTKTFGEFSFNLFRKTRYKFVATATPDPNEYQELISYAAFLDICDISQARTRFFKRDSTKADNLTLHPHKAREFWLWLSTWAIFLQKPSDLGYSDEGYKLPEIEVHWHELPTDHAGAGFAKDNQGKMFRDATISVRDAAKEKRYSLAARIAKLMELRQAEPDATRIIWHDLEVERHAIKKAIPTAVSIYGSQDLDQREQDIIDFSDGKIQELSAKPVIAGSGCNFQRHCWWEIFLGIGYKFNDFIQGIHRVYRFLQNHPVRIDIIYTESEREIKRVLLDKWERHKAQTAEMAKIIREYGLARASIDSELSRSMGVERQESQGQKYRAILNDCVLETRDMPDSSVHLVLTSIPFSTQYEYSPSYNDFGHTDDNRHFFAQMDYLTPELLRVLRPGRVAAVHVKDRVVPSGMTGLGFQVVYPFHCDVISHYQKHGFAFLGMKTVITDVVRENNQTYRLGWTEQCKDGSRMGAGMPEYVLLFRKPPTDHSNGYADEPVVKTKPNYSRSRWQIDAHGFMRSAGDRLMTSEEIFKLSWGQIYRLFRKHSHANIYDFEKHVQLSESLEFAKRLPVDFMLLPPQSWHPDVWTDVTRMLSLNSRQAARGQQTHLCPLQFDIVDRIITQFSMKGETVYDPFAGLMTVPSRAVRLGRVGVGCELNSTYFADGAVYCQAAEREVSMPSLFDLEEMESVAEPDVSENVRPTVEFAAAL